MKHLKTSEIENPLIKISNENPEWLPKTVILAGNGVVNNGWEPYRNHLRCVKNNLSTEMNDYLVNIPDPTLYLARHSYRSRFFNNQNGTQQISNLGEITKSIAQKYNSERLDLREFPKQTLLNINPEVFEDFGVITTNWDNTLYNDYFFGSNIIQLHGRCNIPESLILPTDFAVDAHVISRYPFLNDTLKKSEEWLRNAKYIIIWGLNFNLYDSELIGIAPIDYTRNKSPLELFVIINPNLEARDRAAYTFGVLPPKRIDFDPNRFELIKHINTFVSKK